MFFNIIFIQAIVREDESTGLSDRYQNMTVIINYVSFRRLGKLMLITYKLFYSRIGLTKWSMFCTRNLYIM